MILALAVRAAAIWAKRWDTLQLVRGTLHIYWQRSEDGVARIAVNVDLGAIESWTVSA